jgi:signal transduction histidine kinase
MRPAWYAMIFCACCFGSVAQPPADMSTGESVKLDQWKIKTGDDPAWAARELDDSGWEEINTNAALNSRNISNSEIRWLRKEIPAEHTGADSLYGLMISQFGASDIYVNGRLVKQYGRIVPADRPVIHNPHGRPVPIQLDSQAINVISIRFAPDALSSGWAKSRAGTPLLRVQLQKLDDALKAWERQLNESHINIGAGIVSAVFSLLFLLLFLFFPKHNLYLFYGLFNLFLMLMSIVSNFIENGQYGLETRAYLVSSTVLISRLIGMSVLLFILHALNRMRPIFWWYVGFMVLVEYPLTLIMPPEYMKVSNAIRSIVAIICIWLAYHAFRSKNREDILVGILACTVVMVNTRFLLESYSVLEAPVQFSILPPILTTITISTYLALRYSHMHRDLERQLVQVHALSEENLKKEVEKQQILSSQKKELEKQVEERTASLNQQKKELQITLNELKAAQAQLIQSEKMASLGELTAGIAHEIQNPLNFVNNFSDLNKELIGELQEELKKGDVREAASIADNLKDNEEKINLHGRRADMIVKSMLQHSRASSGQKEPTDVNKLVDEYVRLAYHGYRAKKKDFNATLDIQLDPEVGQVQMVAQEIGRVLLNLLNNAFQAVEEKAKTAGPDYQPTVSIKTHLGNEEFAHAPMRKSVLIRVADNGTGIPDAIKDKIFQPFFTTKPTGQGTGLGLSLSYDIVTKGHEGSLGMESIEGEGSTFFIHLPKH